MNEKTHAPRLRRYNCNREREIHRFLVDKTHASRLRRYIATCLLTSEAPIHCPKRPTEEADL